MLAQTPQDQYIKVGSVKTRYWVLGDKGLIVILLHGGGGFIECWLDNIFALAQYHRVYAFDMVGAGRSDKPDSQNYACDDWVRFLKSFMDVLQIERATLIGTSGGGATALKFALMFPECLDKLVLTNSGGLGKETPIGFKLALIPGVGELLTHPSPMGIGIAVKQAVYDLTTINKQFIEMLYQMAALPGAQQAILKFLRTNANFRGWKPEFIDPIVSKLSTIASPTLIIHGQQDKLVPVAHAHVAAKNIPNAQLHIFDHCGHWASIEHPEEFNQLVLEFLAT